MAKEKEENDIHEKISNNLLALKKLEKLSVKDI